VLKNYLQKRLETQSKVIEKNNKKVDENMTNINSMKKEIDELKTTAKNFAQKDCSSCNSALGLPTIHFMCGHTYHDYCLESEGIRRCTKCADDFQNLIDMKEQYAE